MARPFPGMDPWLEHPDLWRDVHNSLIAALRDDLAPLLRPRYAVALEARTYVAEAAGLALVGSPNLSVEQVRAHTSGRQRRGRGGAGSGRVAVLEVTVPVPDVVRETWLQVRAVKSGDIVTVVEILSPTNKLAGEGRALYLRKRDAIFATRTSLVEIDLIRAGARMPVVGADRSSEYRILLSRGERRPRADLLLFSIRDAIPRFGIPLRPGDVEPEIDLSAILDALYERAGYDLRVDYGTDPVPALARANREWAADRLRAARLR